MKKYLTRLFVVALVLCGSVAFGQQDPLYSLYINNPLMINPAYTGINNNLTAAVNYRNQWAAFDGNPTTLSANGHVSLLDNKIGAGLLVTSDRIGEISNTSVTGSYAYKIATEKTTFSFGMQAGFVNYRTNPSALSLQDPDDPAFRPVNETKFSLGAGAMLKSDSYMVGFSVPRMLSSELSAQDIKVYQQHIYMFGSYAHVLSERLLLKPAVLLRGVKGAPLSADLNVTIDVNRAYAVGIFTRNFNTLGAQAQLTFLEKYRLGYVFEVPFSNSVGTHFTSHEVMLSIRTAVLSFHDSSITTF